MSRFMILAALAVLVNRVMALDMMERGASTVLGVNITTPTQCGTSIVRWSGDEGPYHLLLTPTTLAAHSYNDWIESIPAGTSSFNLTIRQPAGLQFLLTMWGKSGILSAGTTDVMTVGPSSNASDDTSCFLSDQEILDRYAFSFNATSSNPAFPPQCSNITLSWPTSLESNVTGAGQLATRQNQPSISDPTVVDDTVYQNLDASSSTKTAGNTTTPPTIFGIIPLGNSFSVPVTYSSKSSLASTLPESYLSDDPTTFTSHGVTYLNFTVAMTKGTRFVLVMGLGQDEDWASGGSSGLMTVGQGSFGCFFPNPGEGGDTTSIPSITATTTDGPVETDGGGHEIQSAQPKPVSKVAIILACIFSVLATLLAVCLCCGVYRLRKRRRANTGAATGKVIDDDSKESLASNTFLGLGFGRRGKAKEPSRYETSATPLDILGPLQRARTSSSSVAASPTDRSALDPQGHYGHPRAPANSSSSSPVIPNSNQGQNLYHESVDGAKRPFVPRAGDPSRETTMSSVDTRSPSTPLTGRPLAPWRPDMDGPDWVTEEPAQLRTLTPLREYEPLGALAVTPPRGPLVLHNAEPIPVPDDDDDHDGPGLKRDTLAFLGSPTSLTGPSAAQPIPPRRRTRPRDDSEMRYVVHRDAGRVRPPDERVLELPPRYEEMNWEQEDQGAASGTVPAERLS